MSRIKLLPGQEHISCTGDQLENEYYCFSYSDRKDQKKKVSLFVAHMQQNIFLN